MSTNNDSETNRVLGEIFRKSNATLSSTDHIPEIEGADYSIGSLMVAISNGSLKLPVWIRYNRSRHLLRPENASGIVQGLLIALEDLTSDL